MGFRQGQRFKHIFGFWSVYAPFSPNIEREHSIFGENGVLTGKLSKTHKTIFFIEVKWTATPTLQDAKHLQTFLSEYEGAAKGYIVCRIPRKMKLNNSI